MAGLSLEIVNEVPADLDLGPTRQVFAKLLDTQIALPEGTINVALVDDAQSRRLNKEYSNQDYATDVLSFSYIENDGEPIAGVIGEIAVSVETAAEQARAAGTGVAEEVALLVLHGVLHIAGYDHQSETDQARLQLWQKQIMSVAGYAYREFKWKNS